RNRAPRGGQRRAGERDTNSWRAGHKVRVSALLGAWQVELLETVDQRASRDAEHFGGARLIAAARFEGAHDTVSLAPPGERGGGDLEHGRVAVELVRIAQAAVHRLLLEQDFLIRD